MILVIWRDEWTFEACLVHLMTCDTFDLYPISEEGAVQVSRRKAMTCSPRFVITCVSPLRLTNYDQATDSCLPFSTMDTAHKHADYSVRLRGLCHALVLIIECNLGIVVS